MSNIPSFSQIIRFCFSYKFFPFIPFLAYVVLPASIQQMFVLGRDSPYPFFLFEFFIFLFLLICLGKKQINRNAPDLLVPIIIYLLIAILSTVANDISRLLIGLRYHLDFILYAFLFRYVVYNKTEVSIVLLICKILILFLAAQLVLMQLGIITIAVEYSNVLFRGSSTAGAPNATGHILYLLCVVTLAETENKYIKFLIYLITGMAIFFTLCRGAILAFLLFVVGSILIYERHSKFVTKVSTIVFFIVLALTLNHYFHFTEVLEERQEQSLAYSNDDYSAGRFERWQQVLITLKNDGAFILGEGMGITPMNKGELYYLDGTSSETKFSPHNVYLGVLAETGIITLFIFLLILLKTAKRFSYIDKYLFIGIVIFYGVSFMTEVTTYTQNYAVLIWFAYYNLGGRKIQQ